MNPKTLKIRSGHYDYQFNTLHPYRKPRPVPFILLKGYWLEWLERLNFNIGKAVNVELKKNQLVLTVVAS